MSKKKQLFEELFGKTEEVKLDGINIHELDLKIEEATLLEEGISIDPQIADALSSTMVDVETFEAH